MLFLSQTAVPLSPSKAHSVYFLHELRMYHCQWPPWQWSIVGGLGGTVAWEIPTQRFDHVDWRPGACHSCEKLLSRQERTKARYYNQQSVPTAKPTFAEALSRRHLDLDLMASMVIPGWAELRRRAVPSVH